VQSDRIAIAQEIHDGIAQDLIALGYQIDCVLAEPDTPALVRHEIRTIRHDLSTLIVKVRNEIFDLRKSHEFWKQIHLTAGEISPLITVSGDKSSLDPQDEGLLTQVLPELLRNAANHSGATEIDLSFVSKNNHCVVTISDNGSGGAKITENRYGLLGCVERVQSHGASLVIETGLRGTTITISL
jgi:NarL family two-component system sensor histidine kinase LiaS